MSNHVQNSELILPILEQLQEQVSSIDEKVSAFVPRRHLTESTKQQHISAITLLVGRCPCCGVSDVVIDGMVLGQFDHFYSRERSGFTETWLICLNCHRDMKDRALFTSEFECYQKRAAAIEGGQLSLI